MKRNRIYLIVLCIGMVALAGCDLLVNELLVAVNRPFYRLGILDPDRTPYWQEHSKESYFPHFDGMQYAYSNGDAIELSTDGEGSHGSSSSGNILLLMTMYMDIEDIDAYLMSHTETPWNYIKGPGFAQNFEFQCEIINQSVTRGSYENCMKIRREITYPDSYDLSGPRLKHVIDYLKQGIGYVGADIEYVDGSTESMYLSDYTRFGYGPVYDGNGNTSGEAPVEALIVEPGQTISCRDANTLAKDGYVFSEWNTQADGSGTSYSPDDEIIMQDGDITLYAQWEVSYTLTYQANGAETGTVPVDTNTYLAGTQVTVASNTGELEITGYVFDEWNTAADGSGVSYEQGTTLEFGTEDITLYAQWVLLLPITREELEQMIAKGKDVSKVNTSEITDMSYLFEGDTTFNQDISGWDVSNVTDMGSMFFGASVFNQDISGWDVGNATNMSRLFQGAVVFNQDISGWDVSNVTDMDNMFSGASAFNQDISSWDVGNVTDMRWLFFRNSTFNQDISGWDVSNVTNMLGMFRQATAFNQDISSWDVSNVTDMRFMFWGATSFNQDLAIWDVSNVFLMEQMFLEATSFNGDISDWDVSNVTDMGSMFFGASVFNQDISGWDVGNATNMSRLFQGSVVFNQDISGWDVSNVTDMGSMFFGASVFNQDISGWDVGNATNMSRLFQGAVVFNQDISGWDVSNVTDMGSMFSGASAFNQDVSGWNVSSVTDMSNMFWGALAFNQDISGWDVSNVTDMGSMFSVAVVFNQDLSGWADHVAETIGHEGFSLSCPLTLENHPYPSWDE